MQWFKVHLRTFTSYVRVYGDYYYRSLENLNNLLFLIEFEPWIILFESFYIKVFIIPVKLHFRNAFYKLFSKVQLEQGLDYARLQLLEHYSFTNQNTTFCFFAKGKFQKYSLQVIKIEINIKTSVWYILINVGHSSTLMAVCICMKCLLSLYYELKTKLFAIEVYLKYIKHTE